MFGVHKLVAVPIMALVVWWSVLKGNYSRIEKVFFVLCATFFKLYYFWYYYQSSMEEVLLVSVRPTFHE